MPPVGGIRNFWWGMGVDFGRRVANAISWYLKIPNYPLLMRLFYIKMSFEDTFVSHFVTRIVKSDVTGADYDLVGGI